MESYILNDFEVKSKHSSEEALQKWRKLCGFVKNPKRRFRFTANLSKRYEAQAMRRTNQVSPLSLILFIIYLFHSTKKKKIPQCPIKSFQKQKYRSYIMITILSMVLKIGTVKEPKKYLIIGFMVGSKSDR